MYMYIQETDFVGKEALRKVLEDGWANQLVTVTVDSSDVDPEGNESVWIGNQVSTQTVTASCRYFVFAVTMHL